MKHVVTKLEGKNEPVQFIDSTLGNYFVDTLFGVFQDDLSPYAESSQQYEILNYT